MSISDLHEDDDNLILYRPSSFSLWYTFGSMFMCVLSVLCKEQGITVIVSTVFIHKLTGFHTLITAMHS